MTSVEPLTRSFTELPPLALYVHLPWCVKKCPYCDFNSHEAKGDIPEAKYIDALLDDLATEMPSVWGRTFSSVFIGGGTPSLFSADAMHNLLSGVRALTGLTPNAEVTMEANPGAIESARFHEFKHAGVNRLSIGIQSFNDVQLQRLGRVHDSCEAHKAVEVARKAGFDNLNLDLMFGLPEQSQADALTDLQTALTHSPEHLSYYELTIEPNTLFARFPPKVPEDDKRWDMQQAANSALADAGFKRYEVSAWSQPNRESQHNLNYWLFGDYVGIGAGAHGKISFADSNKILRRWKHKHPNTWMDAGSATSSASSEEASQQQSSGPDHGSLSKSAGKSAGMATKLGGEDEILVEDTGLEFMMNALRLSEGFSLSTFTTHTGVSIQPWLGAIQTGVDQGLLSQSAGRLKATERGFELLNDVLALFMPTDKDSPDTTSTASRITIPIKPA